MDGTRVWRRVSPVSYWFFRHQATTANRRVKRNNKSRARGRRGKGGRRDEWGGRGGGRGIDNGRPEGAAGVYGGASTGAGGKVQGRRARKDIAGDD